MIGFRLRAVRAVVVVLLMCGVPAAASAQGPVITSPSSPTVLPAGPDFATDVLANPWDFSDANDLSPFPDEIRGWTNSGSTGRSVGPAAYLNEGKFVGSTQLGGVLTLLYRGGQNWVPSELDHSGVMDHRAIPTSRYGKFSVAVSVTSSQGADLVAFWFSSPYDATDQRAQGARFNNARPGTHIYTVDLVTGAWTDEHGTPGHVDLVPGGYATKVPWDGEHLMRGFSLHTTSIGSSLDVAIDWVRLTQRDNLPDAATLPLGFTGCAGQEYNVEVSAAGISPQVIHTAKASSTGTTTANVNYGVLPPGIWNFQVRCYSGTRGPSGSSESPAVTITINQPPIVTVHNPDAAGGADFASEVLGNAWDMDALSDIRQLFHVTDASIVPDGPASALQATADNKGDPIVLLVDSNAAIDSARHRNLTFSLELDTPFGLNGGVGDGSMARIIWSTPSGHVSTTRDLLVWPGRNLYTIDLSQLTSANGALEPGSLPWGAAPVTTLRIDPHESTKNVRFRLGPTSLTAPDEVVLGSQFTVHYAFADSDITGSTYEARLYRAGSRQGARTLIDTVSGVLPNQPLQYQLDPVARAIPAAEYFLYVEITESRSGITDTRGLVSGGSLRVLSEAPPAPSPAPGAPTLVPVQVSTNPIVISFSAGFGMPPTSYTVAAGSAPGASDLGVFPVGLQTVVSGNVPGSSPVYIRVTAHNAQGSATSNEIIVQIGGAVSPPAPPVLTPTQVTTNPVSLAWAAGGGGAPTGYTVVAGTAPGASNLGVFPMGGVTSISAVAPEGFRIFVRVVASNGAGQATSNEINFQIGGGSVPGVPMLHAPVIDGSTVSLSWTAPGSGGAAASYVLLARAPEGPLVAVLPVSGTSFSTVAPSGTYLVTVVAVNGAGQGPESNQITVIVP